MGDPAGVGPELCLRVLASDACGRDWRPLVIGDADVLEAAKAICPELSAHAGTYEVARNRPTVHDDSDEPNVWDLGGLRSAVTPGVVDASTGAAAYRYIEAAIAMALAGEVDAIATGPIHKEALWAAGIHKPGHTEILAEATSSPNYCMMLTAKAITCSFVTTHVGYVEAAELLTIDRIVDVGRLTVEALRKVRGREPRLVVCGLNPHAGEHGLFGNGEEQRIIEPAVERLREEFGVEIIGPLPPDTAFLPARRQVTDGFICMYHDQGHIPLKALAFDEAVNITLGLPIIRTSVDHGTALDIAWKGVASPTSFLQAIGLAARLATPAKLASRSCQEVGRNGE